MSYKKPFKERNKFTNISEKKCEKYLKSKNISFFHFGFSQEKRDEMKIGNNYFNLDYRLKKQPDYLINSNNNFYFIECKSFDSEDNLRLKDCDVKGYKYWNYFKDLYFFIYSHKRNKYLKISLDKLINKSKTCETKLMPDNKEPYKLINLNKLIN